MPAVMARTDGRRIWLRCNELACPRCPSGRVARAVAVARPIAARPRLNRSSTCRYPDVIPKCHQRLLISTYVDSRFLAVPIGLSSNIGAVPAGSRSHHADASGRVNYEWELSRRDDRLAGMRARYSGEAQPSPGAAEPLGVPGTARRVTADGAVRMIMRGRPRRQRQWLLSVGDTGESSSPAEGAFASAEAKLTCPLSAFPVRREEASSP